ncbi:MAG: hypothetical protein MJ025_04390, partial [Victivallaceae bacterium]|nr:hypothetical protein [Victivallaceae bacterium]
MKESYVVATGVFAVILMTGTLFVVGLNSKTGRKEKRPLPEMPSYRPAKPPLPPVQLIRGAVVEKGLDGSWDYSGHVNDNFVTTRARLISSLSSQSWKLTRTIVLDEVLSPKTIFTFV